MTKQQTAAQNSYVPDLVPISVAAARLGVSRFYMSDVIKRLEIPTQRDSIDKRYRLVDYNHLRYIWDKHFVKSVPVSGVSQTSELSGNTGELEELV